MIKKITKFTPETLNQLCAIWLTANLDAHHFVPKTFWKNQLHMVKQLLPQATIYGAYKHGILVGFIGLNNHYIEGLFIEKHYRNQRIGTTLLNHVKQTYDYLKLSVYQKNDSAIQFYSHQGFQLRETFIDNTGEISYAMYWGMS